MVGRWCSLRKKCLDTNQKQFSQMFLKICVLWNFARFTWKRRCWCLFLTKFQAGKPVTLFKKEILTQVFSCEYCKTFKNIFFIKQLRWLILMNLFQGPCLPIVGLKRKKYDEVALICFINSFPKYRKSTFYITKIQNSKIRTKINCKTFHLLTTT